MSADKSEERTNAIINRRIAPIQERESMRRDIVAAEQDDSGESPEFSREVKKLISQESGSTRRARTQAQIARMKRVYANSLPQPLTDAERASLESQEKILTAELQKMMVSKKATQISEFENGQKNSNFSRVANEISRREHSPEFLAKAHRLKNIKRTLYPNDPTAGNLEFIRPD